MQYVRVTGINNDMNELLWSTKDFKTLADWMTKYATSIFTPIGMGLTLYKNE